MFQRDMLMTGELSLQSDMPLTKAVVAAAFIMNNPSNINITIKFANFIVRPRVLLSDG